MNNFIEKIVSEKKESLRSKKVKQPVSQLEHMLTRIPKVRGFKNAITNPNKFNIIGEVKKASPSAGIIRHAYEVGKLSKELEEAGVSAISVLTEEKYFHGDLFHLIRVYDSVIVPILRKDFIIDEYQIIEARVYFADAVLLIAELLSQQQLTDYLALSRKLGLDAIVELHNEAQVEKVLNANPDIIGINNRDLDTFQVDLKTTLKIKKLLPADKIIVSESGMKTRADIYKLKEAGINAALIGEALMRSGNIKSKVMEFTS
ncbi:MAG: hypothetical protein A2252_10850 [Elusimicrobia bacterium RIFOXYA2_FULL_39_19]|nr:MAG: hypothetical protein A2252_10850 [Elusimicrobia bacterium RIFOXYA2_FULL_39_19]